MTPDRKASVPTDAEIRILRVLWAKGPTTVRDVHEVLNAERPAGYTTTLKIMQIMLDKGLVTRDESERTHRLVRGVLQLLVVVLPATQREAREHRPQDRANGEDVRARVYQIAHRPRVGTPAPLL